MSLISLSFLVLLLPTAISGTPLQIGCNVEGLRYYDEDLKMCDMIKQASPFGVPEGPWKGNVAIDTKGWPLADFSVILYMGGPITEVWRITGAGKAPTIAPNACSVKVLNTTYDPGSDAFTSFLDTAAQAQVILTFTGTDGGIQNLSVWRTSCGEDTTAIFHPAYLQHIQRCTLLRFLDFEAINDNNKTSWAAEKSFAYPQWTDGGAPWGAAIALANAVQADVWINIPTLADDNYITQLATLLLQQLHPTATILTQYSNEVWNFGFDQFHWVVAAANASVLTDGDPYRLNYSNESNVYYWANRFTAYQEGIRIPRLFAAVFGNGSVGQGARVRPVLAGQVSYTAPLLQGVRYLESVWAPPSTLLHAFAGAPYFGAPTANSSTVPEVLERVVQDVATLHPSAGWGLNRGLQQHATLAAWYRVFFHGYEGGPDFSGAGNNYTLTGEVQRDPGFTPAMTQYYLNWAAYGNAGPLNQFEAGASNWGVQFGCWGLVEDIGDTTSTKLAAFDAARTTPRPPNALGIPIPTQGFPAGFCSGCSVANQSSAGPLGMHAGEPWVLYPVNLAGLAVGAKLSVAIADHNTSPTQVVEVGLNSGGFQNMTLPGVATFTLSAEDVGGAFGGVGAFGLRGVTPGAYYVVDNFTFSVI